MTAFVAVGNRYLPKGWRDLGLSIEKRCNFAAS